MSEINELEEELKAELKAIRKKTGCVSRFLSIPIQDTLSDYLGKLGRHLLA